MRKSLLIMMAACSGLGALASPLTPQEAIARLGGQTRGGSDATLKLAYTSRLNDGEAALYVFNNTDAAGYLILSADDCAAPLLGYSDNGSFREEEMSPEMKWWLGEYGRQIEYAKSRGLKEYVAPSTRAGREAVAPLIKTKWNQSEPYNGMTPTVDGKHCVTGCVATATAQVMKYWNYPEYGKGESTCYVSDPSGGETEETMTFGEQKFDWSNMLDVYTSSATQAQKDAVAYLMKSCGYGVHMNYTTQESGAADIYVASTLIENFGYNKNLQYCNRNNYDPTAWDEMVYAELALKRPVVYGGQSTQGGHCFVCDGYDGNGMYHFNWGWGGMSDGYFSLNALNPNDLGIGANGGGYNFYQDIVRGIQPTTTEYLGTSLCVDGNISGTMKANELLINVPVLINYDGQTLNFDLGASIEPLDGGETTYKASVDAKGIALQPLYFLSNATISIILSTALPDGSYKVTLSFCTAGGQDWHPVLASQLGYNYLIVTKKGSKFTVAQNKSQNIKIEDGGAVGTLAYGQASKLNVKVSNPTDREITVAVYPVLCNNNQPVMIAQGLTLNMKAGEVIEQEFNCLFSPYNGAAAPTETTTYTLRFYDPSVYNEDGSMEFYPGFSKTVTMEVGGTPKLEVENFDMPGLEYSVMNTTAGPIKLYSVTDITKVPVSLTLSNSGGYFANSVILVLYKQNGTSTSYPYFGEYTFPDVLEIGNGETKTLNTEFNIPELTDGNYIASPAIGYNLLDGDIYFKVNTSGVDEVYMDTDMKIDFNRATGNLTLTSPSAISSVEVYMLNGSKANLQVEVAGNVASADMSTLSSGIYVVKMTTEDGKSMTSKVVK
ncbi:MAG: thiol protease/hemagglutinin PrtT [Muribaculaceae bacterium]|nr:thiol protease/hemagglutinin PrtT [Muribaculaceae bacterium]